MRIRDWSSDVCSSDLVQAGPVKSHLIRCYRSWRFRDEYIDINDMFPILALSTRSSCRKRQQGASAFVWRNVVTNENSMSGRFAITIDGVEHLLSDPRSEEHTSELQSLMRISYAVFCLKKKKYIKH